MPHAVLGWLVQNLVPQRSIESRTRPHKRWPPAAILRRLFTYVTDIEDDTLVTASTWGELLETAKAKVCRKVPPEETEWSSRGVYRFGLADHALLVWECNSEDAALQYDVRADATAEVKIQANWSRKHATLHAGELEIKLMDAFVDAGLFAASPAQSHL